jgi:23S rRNA (cytidine1920-2'-O)/16S rRNA (cytidine1409-2'-O)-methyltransferase
LNDDHAPDSGQQRRRLDAELVRRGLFATRSRAQAAIAAGGVRVDGEVARRPAEPVTAIQPIVADEPHPWVSRGGVKLAHALDAFGVDPAGLACLDVGASTGGFSQVLLRRGARRVVAVDVGRGQLDEALRGAAGLASLEGVDARALTPDLLGEPPQLVVADVSFIGLAKALARPLELAAAEARLVALFKPQFEVGRAHVGKGGVVSDEAATARARAAFADWLEASGWTVKRWEPSPIAGGDGNAEWLVWAVR